jgi:hypothetical protein
MRVAAVVTVALVALARAPAAVALECDEMMCVRPPTPLLVPSPSRQNASARR